MRKTSVLIQAPGSRLLFSWSAAIVVSLSGLASAGEWSGFIAEETRLFTSNPLDSRQLDDHNLSVSGELEFFQKWRVRREIFRFRGFARYDQNDDERTHFDLRELSWEKAWEKVELRLGIRKVFWGVTESQHLVDIINQTDLVENMDGEDKLGQPMVNAALVLDWGTIDFFLLPGFRERTLPGQSGRPRTPLPVENDARYESGAEQAHVDWAARWSHSIGGWDIGLSHFSGTSREPQFLLPQTLTLKPKLTAFYDQIDQTGFDVQYTRGGWLLKFEGIHRSGQVQTFNAITTGFEYTFYNLFESGVDLGLLTEYSFDDRQDSGVAFFQNDLFVGFRFGFNDVQSTQILAGALVDLDDGTTFVNVEASRRLGQNWKLSAELRAFLDVSRDDVAYGVHKDDHIQVELARFF